MSPTVGFTGAVALDVELLVINILVTTAVVADGTVYSVVDEVAAAVLARALVVVAISYYPFFTKRP